MQGGFRGWGLRCTPRSSPPPTQKLPGGNYFFFVFFFAFFCWNKGSFMSRCQMSTMSDIRCQMSRCQIWNFDDIWYQKLFKCVKFAKISNLDIAWCQMSNVKMSNLQIWWHLMLKIDFLFNYSLNTDNEPVKEVKCHLYDVKCQHYDVRFQNVLYHNLIEELTFFVRKNFENRQSFSCKFFSPTNYLVGLI